MKKMGRMGGPGYQEHHPPDKAIRSINQTKKEDTADTKRNDANKQSISKNTRKNIQNNREKSSNTNHTQAFHTCNACSPN